MTADIIGLPTIREAKKVRTLREASREVVTTDMRVIRVAINGRNHARLQKLAAEWHVTPEEAAGMMLGQALNPRCK